MKRRLLEIPVVAMLIMTLTVPVSLCVRIVVSER